MECGEPFGMISAMRTNTCFNGAALVGVRREVGSCRRLSISFVLQRSRTRWSAESLNFLLNALVSRVLQRSRTRWSAERGQGLDVQCRDDGASTEPHSLECGEDGHVFDERPPLWRFNGAALVGVRRGAMPSSMAMKYCCFNGAALVGVRRVVWGLSSRRSLDCASTEPHSLECGVLVQRIRLDRPLKSLQRSRTRWSAERAWRPPGPRCGGGASTEPHSLECGEVLIPQIEAILHVASTEPHSLECGEVHMLSNSPADRHSFNGAALVGVRRVDREESPVHILRGFNGAALVGVRRGPFGMLFRLGRWCFNGAALVGVRRVRRVR